MPFVFLFPGRGVAQLVARVVRDDEAVGSSPTTPTRVEEWIDARVILS